jgi:hypothetical protein
MIKAMRAALLLLTLLALGCDRWAATGPSGSHLRMVDVALPDSGYSMIFAARLANDGTTGRG